MNKKPAFKCNTVYPVILIHGSGFRDDHKLFNYWGRIPGALEASGANIFYSGQDAWGSIENNARTIKSRVRQVLKKTGRDKVNLIAHSRGGLEARYMISELGMHDSVASLTTISTPHHGSRTLDFIYDLPAPLYKFVSYFVNFYFRLLGDKNPDFYTSSRQLSQIFCKEFNERHPDLPGIYYQSYAARMKNPFSDLMYFFTYIIVKLVEGDNDGLCPVYSAKWGDFQYVITGKYLRGVSHSDVVDLWRMNFSGIDMRKIYVEIVENLKNKGF